MEAGDEETLKAYIDESLEHLAGIETDLLEIEKSGSQIDIERVNKVFRAAHSIKGGAGFIGLDNIKNLSHHMENVLGLMRTRKLIPNPENINFLLLASDALKDLLVHVELSDERDISDHIAALSSLMGLPESPRRETPSPSSESPANLSFPDDLPELTVSPAEWQQIRTMKEEGNSVYLLKIPLPQNTQEAAHAADHLLEEARAYGTLLTHQMDRNPSPHTLTLLFACVLESEDVANLFEIDLNHIQEISDEGRISVSNQGIQAAEPSTDDAAGGSTPAASDDNTPPPFTNLPPAPDPEEPDPQPESEAAQFDADMPENTLRVRVGLLDSLMTLAGELVLGRNQLLQSLSKKDLNTSETVGKRIDHITSELQEAIMRTRMQPIGKVFNKFPRLTRDLSRKMGKEIELTLEGKNVELDKTLIEAIGDPLTHLVRNAIDHGIEPPEQREKEGKYPIGRIRLKAFHEAGQVNIEIEDDGRGLDGGKLAAEAVRKNFITQEQSERLSENEQYQLIFLPGFSMVPEVTELSGRGVGMDVVKTNLDRLGAQISMSTKTGKGTTFKIKVPLTLAIIPSQIIVTENERYAIPQANLVELIRIPAEQVQERVEIVGKAEVVRLRSRLLPLVRLSDVLHLPRTYTDPASETPKSDRRERIADRRSRKSDLFGSRPETRTEHEGTALQERNGSDWNRRPRSNTGRRFRAASSLNIAVVTSGDMKYGLVVDALLDSEEIVVHPLGRHLKHTLGYAGATIMGDGKVALILDVVHLAKLAELSSVDESTRAKELAKEEAAASKVGKGHKSLLVFRYARDEQFAIPLNQVLRIEKITKADVEVAGGQKVMQYRGGNLLLFAIDEIASVKPLEAEDHLLVLVFMLARREIGLLASGPVDAVDISYTPDKETLKQPGIIGSVVINGQTTLLVDVFEVIKTLNPEWFTKDDEPDKAPAPGTRILIVEDSNFFRNQVKGFIEDKGYRVFEAKDGFEAWNLLEEKGDNISLVVTDLEMPNLDGFGLAEKIKSDERYRHLPVIALTTLAEDEDIEKGRAVGIDDYQIKLDREKLMESIDRFMKGR